ncbi:putative ABC-type dipeptide transport system, periplasmic component [Methanocella conradii HZ254]|uniref:ABC-type dipeptide transport system, periplasmic component n=1 Tax=Methanocella conradii (strain DSM 24694 / JCM 17849 / CGMCC 1.5162 / HZ254) TaxID=1041930 RepID=H8IAT0_METCZ|nr:ABC transporter substrate-binding protein [Methanocella conradii]AFD00585.1 putative ABC-type dipeptide transport system, periplasmic component [Methanocella conradii HZ254]
MDKRSGIIGLVVLVIAAVMILSGCASPTTVTPTPTTKPFTLVEMTGADPPSLDPGLEYDTACYSLTQNVYETLVWYEGKDVTKPVGLLATGWESNDNYTVWTFYLRDNVKFHDGTKFNASAVKYTFDRGVLMNNPNGPWVGAGITSLLKGGDEWMASNGTEADVQAYLANEAVKVINETTVQFTLSRSYPDWYHILAFPATAIVSPTAEMTNMPYTPNNYSDTYYKEHMCGTGPFKFVSWAHEDKLVFERNNDYWRAPAKAERVVVRNVPDVNSRRLAFERGECDFSQENIRNLPVFNNSSKVVIDIQNDTLMISFIGLNMARWPFNDTRMRQAFVESFDYQTYRNEVAYGYGALPHGVVPKGLGGYNESIPTSQYNPEHAKQLMKEVLDEKGYTASNPLTVTIAYNEDNAGRAAGAVMLADTINKYGLPIKVETQPLKWATFLDKQKKGDLDIFWLGWQADFPTADNFLGPFAVSDMFFAKQVGYKNETIDKLYDEYFLAKTQDERNRICYEIQMGLLNDNPYIVYLQPASMYVMNKDLKGYQWNVMLSGFYWYPMYKE